MSDKIGEARREMFQAWWRDDAQEELRKSCAQGWGEFIWNAALDSLCVELPNTYDIKYYEEDGDGSWEAMPADRVIKAIHAAGVKTK